MVAHDGHHGIFPQALALQVADKGPDATVGHVDTIEIAASLGGEGVAGGNPRGAHLAVGIGRVHRHGHHLQEERLAQLREEGGGKIGHRRIVHAAMPRERPRSLQVVAGVERVKSIGSGRHILVPVDAWRADELTAVIALESRSQRGEGTLTPIHGHDTVTQGQQARIVYEMRIARVAVARLEQDMGGIEDAVAGKQTVQRRGHLAAVHLHADGPSVQRLDDDEHQVATPSEGKAVIGIMRALLVQETLHLGTLVIGQGVAVERRLV